MYAELSNIDKLKIVQESRSFSLAWIIAMARNIK